MEEEIARAIAQYRQKTNGKIGPTLRELEEITGYSFSGIQGKIMILLERGVLSAAWLENDGKRRLTSRSLDVTEKGLEMYESLETA